MTGTSYPSHPRREPRIFLTEEGKPHLALPTFERGDGVHDVSLVEAVGG